MGDPLPTSDGFTRPLGQPLDDGDPGIATLEMVALRPNRFLFDASLLHSRYREILAAMPGMTPAALQGDKVPPEYRLDEPNQLISHFIETIAHTELNFLQLYGLWRLSVVSPEIPPEIVRTLLVTPDVNTDYRMLGKDVPLDRLFTDVLMILLYHPNDPVNGNIDVMRHSTIYEAIDAYRKIYDPPAESGTFYRR